jgi:tRNA 5-methylaminomethyl-2-thiouridine biosynthesis bifunctional protein
MTLATADRPRWLHESDLPRRWQARAHYTIVQTGFGAGQDFLAAWACWHADSHACETLHYVAFEAHLLALATLREQLAHLELTAGDAELAQQLCAQWPLALPGTHRLLFAHGRVVLTLIVGPLAKTVPIAALRADAFYVHTPPPSPVDNSTGSSSAKHGHAMQAEPALDPFVLRSLNRMAAHGATLVAPALERTACDHLNACGFVATSSSGHASTVGSTAAIATYIAHFQPHFRVRRHEPGAPFSERHVEAARDAIVIGAGLAGCALVERLAARGWHVTLLERHAQAAQEASGNPAGIFHPIVTADDSFAARLSRSGFLYALSYWRDLHARAPHFDWQSSGLFVAAQNDSEFAAMRATLERLAWPAGYVELLERTQAAHHTGVMPAYGGWLFAQGGWVDPAALCRSQLAAAGTRLTRRFNCQAQRLERRAGRWHVLDHNGNTLADAAVVVVASAAQAPRLLAMDHLPLSAIRGQLTFLPQPPDTASELAPRMPVIGDGYLLRLNNGALMTGASYDLDDTDSALRAASQHENLARLARLVPATQGRYDSAPLAGRVGFRAVTSDRMPLIGPLADEAAARANAANLNGAHLADLPRQAGLFAALAYGSRGLVWAALGAELIAAQLDGAPWPIDSRLADGIDPARFLLRALRQHSAI